MYVYPILPWHMVSKMQNEKSMASMSGNSLVIAKCKYIKVAIYAICDRICEKGSSTHILFSDFEGP